MNAIDWDESLVLGVRAMDDDHRQLISCYNDLFAEFFAGAGPVVVNRALVELFDHTRDHFLREEALMEGAGYPDLASHREEHGILLQSARMLQEKTLADESHPITGYTLSFLRAWLIVHILEADRELAEYLLHPYVAGEGDDALQLDWQMVDA